MNNALKYVEYRLMELRKANQIYEVDVREYNAYAERAKKCLAQNDLLIEELEVIKEKLNE